MHVELRKSNKIKKRETLKCFDLSFLFSKKPEILLAGKY